ncbi:MAG: SseB family protein [Rhodobacteraceae bacterium]|nr:SseB family protein [Paracoccaceae bacterium]
MAAAADEEGARHAFHARLAAEGLFLLIDREPRGETLEPRVFALEEGEFVLAFDREARLAAFVGVPAPYAALPGRMLVALLAGRGLGLGLNLDVAPSAILLPAAAIDWNAARLAAAAAPPPPPDPATLRPAPPLPPPFALLVDEALEAARGLADWAALAGTAEGGLAVVLGGARPGLAGPLARALAEALAFADLPPPPVLAIAADDPLARRLERAGARRDLARPPPAPAPPPREGPRPPLLRPPRRPGVS